MKIPTQWANNDVLAPAQWSGQSKNPAQWANNGAKNPTQYTPVGKSPAAWGPTSNGRQTYFYNDPDMTYNSVFVDYNYLVNGNQSNQLGVTKWGAA